VVTAKVIGDAPPEVSIGLEYDAPTTPPGNELVVVKSSSGTIVRVNDFSSVCSGSLESTTRTVIPPVGAGPVGVPEITPVEGLSVKPGASPPAVIEKVNGVVPPVVVIWSEYGWFTPPTRSGELRVIWSGGAATTNVNSWPAV
jgi:hypothetical protein